MPTSCPALTPARDTRRPTASTTANIDGPTSSGQAATCQGFVTDFAYTIGWESTDTAGDWNIVAGTTASDIMGCFTPQALPVISALAQGYAVCDAWFASVPTETMPNRAFAGCGTSQGHLDDHTKTFTSQSIFGLLGANGISWGIYGYDAEPLTANTFTDIAGASGGTIGKFTDFQSAAAAGTLPSYTFLEPSWTSTGNSQHPNYDVALGEQLIHDVYEALRSGPGWNQTLFILTYDEHGGCYDHVAPPWGATPPDDLAAEFSFGFAFNRFGARVPTVLISPLIAPGTVYRVPAGTVPLDHTSVLKTVEQRWSLPALTARDAAAPGFGDVLTLATARTDDVLGRRHRPGLWQRGSLRRDAFPPGGDPRGTGRRNSPAARAAVPPPGRTPRIPTDALGDQQQLAGRAAGGQVLLGAGRVGERVLAADADVELAAAIQLNRSPARHSSSSRSAT